ncbi:MAG: tyrosine recombinase [Paludibacteraceae bacterium]|nr:tyrosine recombinase [Paludibacteraceae bacterium]
MSSIINEYKAYLALEKSLSGNTIEAYMADLQKLTDYCADRQIEPVSASMSDIEDFVFCLGKQMNNARTEARIISGIRSFYKFLLYTRRIEDDPTRLIDLPRLGIHLPEVLTLDEINRMVSAIDLSHPQGQRNRAIIEMLYGSGLRVSELVSLRRSDIYPDEGYMRILGKGSKQRLVPISGEALKRLRLWEQDRQQLDIKPEYADTEFLNRYGRKLTRAMIFTIVRQLARDAGIEKTISPHTLRHSFATHLLQNGANIMAISALLGHESVGTTQIYTHLDIRELRNEILRCHPMNKT